MTEFSRLLADEYRRHHGRYTSNEIRAARDRLGMSQIEFARHLGVSSSSVKRWELGQIQDEGNNELIRLKTDPEAAATNLEHVQWLIDLNTAGLQRAFATSAFAAQVAPGPDALNDVFFKAPYSSQVFVTNTTISPTSTAPSDCDSEALVGGMAA